MPWSNSDFSRGKGKKKKKIGFVLEKPFHFFVDKKGCFAPRYVPADGALVAIEFSMAKPGNVVITEEDWMVDGVITPMCFVLIWKNGIQYTYQVLHSDKRGYGVLSLVKKEKLEQQPGVKSRTYETGGSRSQYSR